MEVLLLFLLCAGAFLVRVWGMSRFHFWDEMVYLQNAQVICCGKTNYSELDFRPPLISVLFAGVFLIWHSVYAACIATALVNALGPVFLYLAGRRALGRVPAAIAALLLAFAPFFVGVFPDGFLSDDTGNSLLDDSPALTLLLLSLWLQLRALDREKLSRFAWAGLALAATVLMRFGSLPSAGLLLLLPLASKQRWKALAACAAGLLAGMAPYLLWSRLHFGGFFDTLRAGWTGVVDQPESFFFYLRNAAVIFTPAALLGLALAAVWGLWRLARGLPWRGPRASSGPDGTADSKNIPQRLKPQHLSGSYGTAKAVPFQSRDHATGSSWSPLQFEAFLWLWLIADFTFFSAMPHKEPRYILPLAPPVLLLAGSGLARLCALPGKILRPAGKLLVAALLVFTFLPIRERFRAPFIDRGEPQEMLASEFIESQVPPGTGLYMNFNFPAFAFYTSFPIHEMPADGPTLYSDIAQIPPGGVLIVYRKSEGEAWAPDLEWVDANPSFERMRDFSTFVVYRRVAR